MVRGSMTQARLILEGYLGLGLDDGNVEKISCFSLVAC
jgi:hypothetical protein